MEAVMETLTPHEISKILKLHPFTVTRLAREGKIPAFKAGGVWRVRKDQFEQWMNRQTKEKGAVTRSAVGRSGGRS